MSDDGLPTGRRERAAVRLVRGGSAEPPAALTRPALGGALPMLSALMVTGSRPRQAKVAIACFQRQTYPNTELVIVDDGRSDELAEFVSCLRDDRIRMVRLPTSDATLGELRNVSVDHARGELLCQWDDDDFSDPDRLLWQVSALLDTDVAACFLERWLVLWTSQPRLAISTRRLWEGSMVARREAIGRYPSLRRGEDSAVVQGILALGPVVLLDAPELYVYVVHGENTFDSKHFDAHWDAATHQFADVDGAIAQLRDYLPMGEALRRIE
ncbi:MAG: glycosyltransferase [Candidatus Nanopelagicales bacterium]